MTAFFTHYCKKTSVTAVTEQRRIPRCSRRIWLATYATVALAASTGLGCPTAWAQAPIQQLPTTATHDSITLQRDGNHLLLTSYLDWQLPDAIEQALHKGIPVQFITEVHLLRARWYWKDAHILLAQRFQRLSYQPLTRRWRLHSSNEPFDGTGLGTNYNTLAEALVAMQRLVRWPIGDISALPTSGTATLQLRFRIDLSQLPRPLQIGALGHTEWNLQLTHELQVQIQTLPP